MLAPTFMLMFELQYPLLKFFQADWSPKQYRPSGKNEALLVRPFKGVLSSGSVLFGSYVKY